ncbi:MAG: recombinase family protein [Armatimonadota bacterium]
MAELSQTDAMALLDKVVGPSDDPSKQSTVVGPTSAVSWVRVSTGMQHERGVSEDEQRLQIRLYAEKKGLNVIAEFSEVGSGRRKREARVEFQRMLTFAKANKAAVIVHDLSRFSRNSLEGQVVLDELENAGVPVYSVTDPEMEKGTDAEIYLKSFIFANNEQYSRAVGKHTIKGCQGNVRKRDPATGWCYKNGGQPPFGYKSILVECGEERRGRKIMKAVWVLDDTLDQGKPRHEWARECLVMAMKGASLADLCDFCNTHSLKAGRKQYWSDSTWRGLLEPQKLMKYSGTEVYFVHRKDGSIRPRKEWVVVPNAHPAILTPDEVKTIVAVRRTCHSRGFDQGYSRSRTSRYLLSGGLFICTRCGSNMMGLTTSSGAYYVCGSQPHRRGMGCGPGVYVAQNWIEGKIIESIGKLLAECDAPPASLKKVNDKLRHHWEQANGFDPTTVRQLPEIERIIDNIHHGIEQGLDPSQIKWVSERLVELEAERTKLKATPQPMGAPPKIDAAAAGAYRRQATKLFTAGSVEQRKRLVRELVAEIKLTPEELVVEATFQVPESVMHLLVAGAFYRVYHDTSGIRSHDTDGSSQPMGDDPTCRRRSGCCGWGSDGQQLNTQREGAGQWRSPVPFCRLLHADWESRGKSNLCGNRSDTRLPLALETASALPKSK